MARSSWARVLDHGLRWTVIVTGIGAFLGGSANVVSVHGRLAPLGQASLGGLGLLLILVAVLLWRSVRSLRAEVLVVLAATVLLAGFVVGRPDQGPAVSWWPTSVTVLILCWVVGFGSRHRWVVGAIALALFAGVRWWAVERSGQSWRASAGDVVIVTQLVLTVVLGVAAAQRVAQHSDAAERERVAAVDAEAGHSAAALHARRVGRFLHDEVSHALRAVAIAPSLDERMVRSLADRTVQRLTGGFLSTETETETGSGRGSPPPGLLDRLAGLSDGIGVRTHITGKAPALPDEVAEALVAAAAEALRNVARHAAPAQHSSACEPPGPG